MKWVLRIAGGLVGLILLAVVVLLVLDYRKGAGEMHLSTEINASPETVWPWLERGDLAKQWVSWLVEVRKDPSNTSPVGAKEVWVMHDENNGGQAMEVTGVCTEYTPYSRMSVQLSTPGSFDGTQTYVLTDLGGKTRLEMSGKYRYAMWFARLLEPLITPAAEKKMTSDMAKLKSLVEATKQSTSVR